MTVAARVYDSQGALIELGKRFLSCGYARFPVRERKEHESARTYRKGPEVRFVLPGDGRQELEEIRALISAAGFYQAKPFIKHSRLVQPVYGPAALAILDAAGVEHEPKPQ